MRNTRRKSTVREAFSSSLKSKHRAVAGKLSGQYLFRAAVRLVIEYRGWIDDISSDLIGDNVNVNVKLVQRKKSDQEDLSVKDRSILLIRPEKRSKNDIEYIECFIRDIKAFKKYPDDIRDTLASDCYYQYVPAGRTIIRQDQKARALYYIIRGQLQIFKNTTDNITGEIVESEVGALGPGDMFGEIALLHKVPRTATVVSKTSVDLFIITRDVFNESLRNFLLEEWDTLRDALVNFNYFKGWSEATMRECCILSKIVDFNPKEILLGDGKGMVHYVYFLLSGECRLVEHMLVEKNRVGKKIKYKLYESDGEGKDIIQRIGRSKKIDISEDNLSSLIVESASKNASEFNMVANDPGSSAADYIKMISTRKPNTNVAIDRISVITVTLQDVINQWHEITDVVEMLMKQPSVSSLQKYPKNVHIIFMQVCIFYRGACFGLGEQMKNRRVVATTPSKCLLIPRYWLTQHNRANIWARVKQFMNCKYPTSKQLFEKFVENKKWAEHKRDLTESIIKNGRSMPNDTKAYDVPYSIRINENIIDS